MSHPSIEPHPVRPLAPQSRRAVAGVMLATAAGERINLLSAAEITDALDGACWGILGSAGLTPAEARHVLAALWVEPTGFAGSEHFFDMPRDTP